ncbi:MAG TPA: adenylate/guanylate cyclase domain-containing protein [Casimicrobiaceae bacterium]|nr:adenylate/guanylate cyclase domain-containing protein [Casimicrobiaceae bacterium]
MSSEREKLESAIRALESQRALLGDAVVSEAVAPLRDKLASLAPEPSDQHPDQSLRQVTILFLDIVGSTTLSQRLDPEQTSAVMDGALARFASIIRKHGGKVLKFAGDSVLAVFGADQAREDDAERAVRAGLALIDAGHDQGQQVFRQYGHTGFDVRVGVHTGGVLLGGGVDAERSIRGQAVNIAARMEQTAPAGGLRISQDTFRHVGGSFDVVPQPPLLVKGIDEPVSTYVVLRAKPRGFRAAARGIEGVETRLIGRDAELERLRQAFLRLCNGGTFSALTIVGEAGLGKSRLLAEFEGWIDAESPAIAVLRGRASPLTPDQPYGLLRDILARQLHIGDSDNVDSARRKIEAGIGPLLAADGDNEMAEAQAHLLGHLIGIDFSDSRHVSGIRDDPRQIRNRAFHAAANVFRRVASGSEAGVPSPIALLLEDLHWADDGSLDFLDHLGEVNRDAPMLVLCLSRPTLFERRPSWGQRDESRQRIELGPLATSDMDLLADDLLRKMAPVPAELRALIVGRAEGNPFYMEEVVKMLIDQRAIDTTGARWTLRRERLQAAQIPQTLTGIQQARLDGLPNPERLALQQASVIGPVFWDRALAALDTRAPESLPALVRRELTLPRQEAALEDVREYGFSHQVLHHVTYRTLLARTKRSLHARVAAWLAGLKGARANDFLAATAEHFDLADDTASACEYFIRAAEHARTRHAHDVALRNAARAIALLDRDAGAGTTGDLAQRWRLLVVREYTLGLQGRREEQRVALDAMESVADALDDDGRRALVARRRSMLGMRTADYGLQESAARRAMALAERVNDAESRLEAQRLLADALGAQGQFAVGEALAKQGLAEARALGMRRIEGLFLNALSLMASLQDDQVTGLAMDVADLPIWRELGDAHGETVALSNVGADWLWFGELAHARPYLEDALKLSRAIGARALECAPLGNLSQLSLYQGDAAQAVVLARAAQQVAAATKAADYEMHAWLRVGDAELAMDHHEAAAEAFERADSVARATGIDGHHDAMAGLARVAMARGDLPAARRLVDSLLAASASPRGLDGAYVRQVLFTCQRVLAQSRDSRAPELLDSVHAELQARAATITDPNLRRSFLDNVPLHRDIVSAWMTHQSASTAARSQ